MRSKPPCGGGDDWREELEWIQPHQGVQREKEDSGGVGGKRVRREDKDWVWVRWTQFGSGPS